MIDGKLVAAIQVAMSQSFPDTYFGEPQDDRQIPSQCVLIELQSDVVVGSPLQRGVITLNVISQADDFTKSEHSDFAQAVDAAFRSLSLTSSDVSLYGVVAQSTNNLREERHWRTSLPYIVGFGP